MFILGDADLEVSWVFPSHKLQCNVNGFVRYTDTRKNNARCCAPPACVYENRCTNCANVYTLPMPTASSTLMKSSMLLSHEFVRIHG